MKPLLIIIRVIVVGLLWSVFFMESIRVIMLRNWHFDIVNREHWQIAWDLWTTTWVISEPKEWAFVFIVISFIPLWFTGWIALSLVSWGKFIWFIITLPWNIVKNIFYHPVKIITNSTTTTPVTKRVSYKEIRPRALKGTAPLVEQTAIVPQSVNIPSPVSPSPAPIAPQAAPVPQISPAYPSAQAPASFEHSLFKFDESSEDLDFDIDSFDVQAPAPKRKPAPEPVQDEEEYRPRRQERSQSYNRDLPEYRRNDKRNKDYREDRQPSRRSNENTRNNNNKDRQRTVQQKTGNSCLETIRQKGFEIISRLFVKNVNIDYAAISADSIYLCLLDREDGDWLADEERFNDEESLWFSENSHRISPVRKLDIARQAITNKLEEAELDFNVEAILIEQAGNIINTEDMLEIWNSMNITVCRIDRGMPKELQQFARVLPEAEGHISEGKLDKLTKILRNIG